MSGASLKVRVVRGRIVVEVDGEPPAIVARIVTCPNCGHGAYVFPEASSCLR
jgi:ribosomal protein S27E